MLKPDTTRILVTNDDGIRAPGIKILENIARSISDDVWVVAPDAEQSGMGHALTLTEPLRFRKLEEKRFSVIGTPTDCVMMAIHQIMPDQKPTLVLSGVNRGANLAEDMTYSGTIAAAMEGTICGIPSIAFSQVITQETRRDPFPVVEKYGAEVVNMLLEQSWDDGILLNVNFPPVLDEVKGIRATNQGFRDDSELFIDERNDLRGGRYYWIGFRRVYGDPKDHTDLAAVRDGYISVTPLHLDLTHQETLSTIRNKIEKDF